MLIPTRFPVTCHTDNVGKGSIFVAIKGYNETGTKFIDLAIKKGTSEVVLEQSENILEWISKYPSVKFSNTDDTRKTLAILASKKLDCPSSKLKIIGITGTNGKTTTSFLIEHLLSKAGHKTALLGTIKSKILNQEIDSTLTTMGADFIQVFLNECVQRGVEYVILEVSSHALGQKRIYGIEFDIACFTNLTPEHMDFYKNLEEYFEDKCILFNQIKTGGTAIINSDDSWGKKLESSLQKKLNIISYGENPLNKNGFFIKKDSIQGLSINLNHKGEKEEISCSNLFGKFNAYNLTMATLIGKMLKIEPSHIFENFPGVPGRLQMHKLKNGAVAFVDFSHNASSLENVLKALRGHSNHLIVVFGCGGNRDKTKRPLMGKIASNYGDKIILTNDNPREEDPKSIANNVLSGIPANKKMDVIVELDRKKAIKKATILSKPNSIIAISGKGHEKYQIIKKQKFHLDDFEEISLY